MDEQLVIDLLIQDKSAMSIAQMRAEVKKLQSELANLDPNTAEFEAAARRAGELRDNIEDASESVNNMKGDPIESLKGNFEGLGTSVKNLDFEGATRKLNAMGSSMKNINFGAIVKQIGQMGGAFLKMAAQAVMALGPLIAVAGAVAAIAYAFKLQADAEKKAEESVANFNAIMEDSGEVMTAHSDKLKQLSDDYKKLSLDVQLANGEIDKSEYDVAIAKQKYMDMFVEARKRNYDTLSKLETDYNKAVQDIKAEYASRLRTSVDEEERAEHLQNLANLEKNYQAYILKEQKAFNAERLAIEKNFGKEVEGIYTKNNEKEIKAAQDKWASMNKSADEYFKNLQEKYYGAYYTAITTYDEELAKYKEYLANKTWTQKQYDEAMVMLKKTHEREMAELEAPEVEELSPEMTLTQEAFDFWLQKQIEKKALAEKFATETIGLENELEAFKTGQYAKDITSFNWSAELKLEKLKWFYENGKIQEEHYNDAVYQVQMQRLDNYKAVSDTMASISTSFFEFLGNLAEGNEKKQKKIQKAAFKVNKATSATSTAINTSQAIMKIAAEIPFPFSIPLQILTGIQGAAQVAAILSKKFPEDGNAQTGGGGTAPSTAGTTPSIANMYGGGGGTPTTFQSLSPANQPIQKVVVLESDISSAQQNVAKVGVQSTF